MFLKTIVIVLLAGAVVGTVFAASLDANRAPSGPVDTSIYQMRIYEIFDHNREAFHARFRDHAARIMARHGFTILDMWEAVDAGRYQFIYILRWRDEEAMRRDWSAFSADEEWIAIRGATTEEHGQMVGAIEEKTMRMVPYSPRRTG